MRTLRTSNPVARKSYNCDASEWIQHDIQSAIEGMTFSDKKTVVLARRNRWKILKGEKHSCAVVVDCQGELYTWRAITAIHKLCLKYGIYDYDAC